MINIISVYNSNSTKYFISRKFQIICFNLAAQIRETKDFIRAPLPSDHQKIISFKETFVTLLQVSVTISLKSYVTSQIFTKFSRNV